ncbi:aminoglycoside phosphotransferase [Bifidobacterium pseudolongum subsp. pseudolongum]|uniref:Aminoglycoside phosphotransferase n=2 Tax=Bifidobacterium pseudolongum TaxID=1694 RepID=A0A4V1Y2H6_9BIFI|nr:aminoglycoside phosphotransferase [Bifidobacterium pseudolongum subsp. pseudolongum]RYQ19968.1 aminoglycoside phosphotransferase [Bifidobacterium pseudolongum subsp. pseudolongum]RYQ48333.1 aminoglycoside phosphotransferase [Bifidobacterium pseudolongum subsp. pseudolongum]RYQ53413.1 aminoglycoside phosphotransferase [Bifidobacterium pseudolongum subsp. pseudolongum]
MLAALASATMPNVAVVGVRDSEQKNETDQAAGIDQAVVQDVHGNFYNVYATNLPQGKKRLAGRVRAARVVDQSRELAGLGFSTDHVVAFDLADRDPDETAVLVTTHPDGVARSLDLLTLGDCASIGTAIGAIHRLRPSFLVNAKYPAFTTGQIHAQLTAWIRRLRQAGHVPQEITDSWAHILETEGLWSFATCPVHGGFSDGDFIFSGSTITTITNWQEMQINDPARDLAWIFSKLDETHRNAVISAYGRILGNRLDDLIMLRANLWVQMDQVGEFIQALNQGDNARIMQFKAQVDRLAHQLGATMHRRRDGVAEGGAGKPPSTVTVNTLLREDQQRRDSLPSTAAAAAPSDSFDQTADHDTTNEHAVRAAVDDRTDSHSIDAIGVIDADDTASRQYAASSETIVIGIGERIDTDATGEAAVQQSTDAHVAQPGPADTKTMLIPLLEREERAMRDAQAGLNGAHPHTSSAHIATTPDDDMTQS